MIKRLAFFKKDSYLEYALVQDFWFEDIFFETYNQVAYYSVRKGESIEIIPQKIYEQGSVKFMLFGLEEVSYKTNGTEILLGQKNSDIQISEGQYIIGKNIITAYEENTFYINGKLQRERKVNYNQGDRLLLNGNYEIIVHHDYMLIIADKKTYTSRLSPYLLKRDTFENFPEYKRAPRIIKKIKDDKVIISNPPTKMSRKKGSLVKVIVPPLVMACSTVAMSLMMGRGMYMLIGLAGTVVSLIFSVTTYISEEKELKQKQKIRNEIYESYLLDMRKTLNKYKHEEREALKYNYPNLQEIETMTMNYSSRIYEKDIHDADFLMLVIGNRDDKSSYQVELDYDALSIEKDSLLEEAKSIYDEHQKVPQKPITIDLKKGHLGIVGEKREIHEQLKWMLAQITFFHSYHDVQFIMLYSKEFQTEFDYIKWYPHAKIRMQNITGNVFSERVRDQVLGSLQQILKDRRLKRDENKKEMSFFPHFVIVIDDPYLVMNHSIMEYLQEPTSELGFSLIYTSQKRENLPENIKTILRVEDMDTGTLLMNESEEVNKRLNLQRIKDTHLEKMARCIHPLNHIQGVSSNIPESITFFGMYGVSTPEELRILDRWETGESHKTLAVPIGLRAEDDIVELNLHEKAHGPHGLVAGTTGSGKSETIQTYILSLAVNFSPYEVGFLLIDYKGGGMANLFKKLPHLLGTITNLDGSESMRALASIKAELARRQRIFNDYNVNNINKYNKLFRANKAEEPLPHLFIISDEFAELKKEQPEFMSELVSVARIGRTLGVHLILATQKPTGVVDDQIWSNSKFKLALKVQDESDSKEIIKTPDAAFITQTGRGYLQVGNNEIYELFQTAWSGEVYSIEKEQNNLDSRIYKINLLGQGEIINQDLSDENEEDESLITQLDVTVDYIEELYEKQNHLEVTKPWLPSLAHKIPSPYTQDIEDISFKQDIDLICPIGLVDIPEEQLQKDYILDFKKDGNLAIFASSGYGKSMTLGTIILTLAVKNNPRLLNFYILDFGNSSLIPYKLLPHTADYMTFDSSEKLGKFIKIIMNEIKERKQVFARTMAQNFDMYNQMNAENPMKSIFVFIDNYDVVKEISMDFEEFVMKMTRDGAGLGIYTIVSATRSNAIRFSTLNNFKNKIAQYTFDDSDATSLLGRSPYKLNDIKGRALIKDKIVSMMQVYSPVQFDEDLDFIDNLKNKIESVSDAYTGEKVKGIPVLPNIFTTHDFNNFKSEKSDNLLVGLSLDKVENVSIEGFNSPYIIIGPSKSGKTNMLEIIMNQTQGISYVFDSNARDLYDYNNHDTLKYINTEDEIEEFVEDLASEIDNRKYKLEDALERNEVNSPKDYFNTLPKWTLFIDEIDDFVAKIEKHSEVEELVIQASSVGIDIVGTTSSSKLRGFDSITKFFKNATDGIVLGDMGMISIFSLGVRDVPSFGNAVLFKNGEQKKIKCPRYIKEEKND